MNPITSKLFDKTDKGLLESKKAVMAFITLAAVLAVYVASLTAIVVTGGKSSGDIVSLANITIVFIGTLMSIALTGQSAVEWKSMSSMENISKTEIENKAYTENIDIDNHTTIDQTLTQNINLKEFERHEGINAPEVKPFGQIAIEEN